MKQRINRHLHHHGRFYVAAALGAAVYAAMSLAHVSVAAAAAGDTFFAVYLAASGWLLVNSTKADVKSRAKTEDEGAMIVIALALAAMAFSVVGIFIVLNQAHRPDWLSLMLALAAAPLGWFVLHTIELKVSPLRRWPWSSIRFQTTLNSPFVVLPVSVVRCAPLVVTHSME